MAAASEDGLVGALKIKYPMASIGLAAGLALAWVATRLLSNLLYGVKPSDPFTLVSVSILLLGVALVASVVPARRAASIDPTLALRAQ